MRSVSPSRSELALAALLATGCAPTEFVAMQSDFVGFEAWERFEVVDDGSNLGHVTGPRAVYLNERPGPGADAFPVGTLIVKAAGEGDPSTWTVIARAKRGGDYNADGAPGWEWFELVLDDAMTPAVRWRGDVGGGYQGTGEDGDTDVHPVRGDCNVCHRSAADNDTVLTPALDLDTLGGR